MTLSPRTFNHCLLLLLFLSPPAWGQSQGSAQPAWEPISIALEEAPAQAVLTSFGAVTGSEVNVDPAIDGKVSISVNKVAWPTVLDALCQKLGCSWSLHSGLPRRLEITAAAKEAGAGLATPISLHLRSAVPRELFASFAKILGADLDMATEGEGAFSVRLDEVHVRTALDAACENLSCSWELSEDGVLRVDMPSAVAPAQTMASLQETLDKPLTLELESAAAKETLQALAKVAGLELALETKIHNSVTLSLREQSLRLALDTVCAQLSCRWSIEPVDSAVVLRIRDQDA